MGFYPTNHAACVFNLFLCTTRPHARVVTLRNTSSAVYIVMPTSLTKHHCARVTRPWTFFLAADPATHFLTDVQLFFFLRYCDYSRSRSCNSSFRSKFFFLIKYLRVVDGCGNLNFEMPGERRVWVLYRNLDYMTVW